MVILVAAAVLSEMKQTLSTEAQLYQDYPDAIRAGLSPSNAITKLLFLVGASSGLVGGIYVALNQRGGLVALAAAGPLLRLT